MKRKKRQSKPQKKRRLVVACVGLTLGLLGAAAYYLLGPDSLPWREHQPPPGRAIENTVELQIALARRGFSPGSIDGAVGSQTKQALIAFQESRELPVTGEWDPSLNEWLRIKEPTHVYIELSAPAMAKLTLRPSSWRERGQLNHFDYHSALEMVAEKTCADPDYIRSLNPQVDWSALGVDDRILAPLVPPLSHPAPPQQPRRHRLARAQPTQLRDPRHTGPGKSRPHRIKRLLPPRQLERRNPTRRHRSRHASLRAAVK